jgi:hypothetical protein
LLALIIGCILLNTGKPHVGLPTVYSRTETATAGNVRAEMDIGRNATLRIWRSGRLAYDEPLTIVQSNLYDGPFGFEVRVDDRGESIVRIGVVPATPAVRRQFPPDVRLEYRFDKALARYIASLVPGKLRDPLWSGNVDFRDVARAGNVVVRTSYTLKDDEFVFAGPVVAISRRDVVVPTGPLPSGIRGPLWWSPFVVDLNNDGEPEIDYGLTMLGTNCCSAEAIYRYDAKRRRYIRTVQQWGFYRDWPRLRDLDGNGIIEFVGTDEDITGRFAPGCCSGPGVIRIGRFGDDRMVWVTREYPALIRADAWDAWRAVAAAAKKQPELQPAETAWYLADKFMLREGADGWARVRRAYSSARWAKLAPQLRDALKAEGYDTTGTR